MKIRIGDKVENKLGTIGIITNIDKLQEILTFEELDNFGRIRTRDKKRHYVSFYLIKQGWIKVINGIH